MKLIPVMTEKSMKLAKHQNYTFWVPVNLTKLEIKKIISEAFNVTVTNVKTLNYKARIKRNVRGKMQTIKARKKAVIALKENEKIEFFEEEKKTRPAKAGRGKKEVKK